MISRRFFGTLIFLNHFGSIRLFIYRCIERKETNG